MRVSHLSALFAEGADCNSRINQSACMDWEVLAKCYLFASVDLSTSLHREARSCELSPVSSAQSAIGQLGLVPRRSPSHYGAALGEVGRGIRSKEPLRVEVDVCNTQRRLGSISPGIVHRKF